ncbi:MAG: sugar ABC transporter permease [Clostridiaceae bacterium]|nr:sugar ABC transporter permease [Clostridiaceae bacterium]
MAKTSMLLPKKGRRWSAVRRHMPYYLLILPGLVWFIIFKYVPMYGVSIAFKNVTPFETVEDMMRSPFIGFKHFKTFINSYYFEILMRNTLEISLLRLVFGFPMPLIFALLLNEVRNNRYKKIVQTISYLPHFISWVVVSGLVTMIVTTDGGLINNLLVLMGREEIYFLGDPRYFRSVLIISGIWKELGWNTIIYLAAITGIDTQLYEAAVVDGCGRFRRAIHITLPGIANIVTILLIFSIGGLLDAGFEQIMLLYSEPVYDVADIIDTYVYRKGMIEMNYSFSTAVGLFKSVIAMALIIIANVTAKLFGREGLW